MFERINRPTTAALVCGLTAAAIAGAWTFQAFGIQPCDLCLKQRIAYYFAIPLSAAIFLLARAGRQSLVTAGFVALTLILALNACLGIYHSGVEFGFWPGPTDCTGALTTAPDVSDFLKTLQDVKVVRCDDVQIRVLWLSLANWNVLICGALAALSARAAMLRD